MGVARVERIEDYALIGDCRSAALVHKNGSIDWFCAPRFDSPACFAALLGSPEHGHWSIAPACPPRSVTRRYRGDSLVLETVFETDEGTVAVIDCMPWPTQSDWPQIARVIEARDLAHAAEIAGGCPMLDGEGTVEIRPVAQLPI